MLLITWTQTQVVKFNIDDNMTSISQEQPRFYICGVSFRLHMSPNTKDAKMKQTTMPKLDKENKPQVHIDHRGNMRRSSSPVPLRDSCVRLFSHPWKEEEIKLTNYRETANNKFSRPKHSKGNYRPDYGVVLNHADLRISEDTHSSHDIHVPASEG